MSDKERWDENLDELLEEVERHLSKATQWHWSYGCGKDGLLVSAMEHIDQMSDYVKIAHLGEGEGWSDEQGHNVILIGSAPFWLRALCKKLRAAQAENQQLRERARKSVARKRQLKHLNQRVRDLRCGRAS